MMKKAGRPWPKTLMAVEVPVLVPVYASTEGLACREAIKAIREAFECNLPYGTVSVVPGAEYRFQKSSHAFGGQWTVGEIRQMDPEA